MATMIERVFVKTKDVGDRYRITSFVDDDGIFFADLAYWNDDDEWEDGYLTQFQQDSSDVVPILKDPDRQILEWFGFAENNVVGMITIAVDKENK